MEFFFFLIKNQKEKSKGEKRSDFPEVEQAQHEVSQSLRKFHRKTIEKKGWSYTPSRKKSRLRQWAPQLHLGWWGDRRMILWQIKVLEEQEKGKAKHLGLCSEEGNRKRSSGFPKSCPHQFPKSRQEGNGLSVAQMVKNLPAMQETWVQSLGWEDPLKEGLATLSSIRAWRIPMDRAWRATGHRVAKHWTWLSD